MTISEENGDRRMIVERLKKILMVLPAREEVAVRAATFWRSSAW